MALIADSQCLVPTKSQGKKGKHKSEDCGPACDRAFKGVYFSITPKKESDWVVKRLFWLKFFTYLAGSGPCSLAMVSIAWKLFFQWGQNLLASQRRSDFLEFAVVGWRT